MSNSDDPGATADAIAEQLERLVSPHLLGHSTFHSAIDNDPFDWLQQEDDLEGDVDENNSDYMDYSSSIETVTRMKVQQTRAATPIISNINKTPPPSSAMENSGISSPASTPTLTVNTPQAPYNVQTPSIVRRSNPSFQISTSEHAHFVQYYESFLNFLQSKRRLVTRLSNLHQQAALGTGISQQQQQCIIDERSNDLQVLYRWHTRSWERGCVTEGNFWLLLYHLRSIGAALMKANDAKRISNHIYTLSRANVDRTPHSLINDCFYSEKYGAPMALRRHKAVVSWLEACAEYYVNDDTTRPHPAPLRPHRHFPENTASGWMETDQQAHVFRDALSLILAGRIEDAISLAQESNLAHKAVLWGGGAPHGYEYVNEHQWHAKGNQHRALWRCAGFKLANKMHQEIQQYSNPDEVAIVALLSSNAKVALDCASLRRWDRGLYAVTKCAIQRLEDDLLHQHNEARRVTPGPPYPGCSESMETYERRHLAETGDLVDVDEETAIDILRSSPFKEMHCCDLPTQATATILMGTPDHLLAFMDTVASSCEELSDEELRLLTHLALYLDSVAEPSHQATVMGVPSTISEYKNALLMAYVRRLAERQDLWFLVVFYSTLMPTSLILEELPPILLRLESEEERQAIVDQLKINLPEQLVLQILQITAERALNDENEPEYVKMEAVNWLCIDGSHYGAAIVAANSLLRRLHLIQHSDAANSFIELVWKPQMGNITTGVDKGAQIEHDAHLAYNECSRAVERWEDMLVETSTIYHQNPPRIDDASQDTVASAAAMLLYRRQLLDAKRQGIDKLTSMAHEAVRSVEDMLQFQGGWLLLDDSNGDIYLEGRRATELDQLRRNIIPSTAFTYIDVCIKTAAWLADTLDNGVEQYGSDKAVQSRVEFCQLLDPEAGVRLEGDSSSPLMPRFWTQRALEAAELVVNEKFGNSSAFSRNEYKTLLENLAEATVADLKYKI